MGRQTLVSAIFVAACLLPFASAQWGRGGGNYGGDPRAYGGGGGGYGGGGYGGGGGYHQQPQGNAVARPGGDASLDDSVRLFLQLDQDGLPLLHTPRCGCMFVGLVVGAPCALHVVELCYMRKGVTASA